MSDMMTVIFEKDHSWINLAPVHIRNLCQDDIASWWNVTRMLAGYADFAVMRIKAKHDDQEAETRMAVFMQKPPYQWKFPPEAETA